MQLNEAQPREVAEALVEAERSRVWTEPLTLGGPSVCAVDVIQASDLVVPAVEVVDTCYAKRGKPGVIDSISDAASCGFVMVGGNPIAAGEAFVADVGSLGQISFGVTE